MSPLYTLELIWSFRLQLIPLSWPDALAPHLLAEDMMTVIAKQEGPRRTEYPERNIEETIVSAFTVQVETETERTTTGQSIFSKEDKAQGPR